MKKHQHFQKFTKLLPYIITAVAVLALVFVGSLDKQNSNSGTDLDIFAEKKHNVSVDQISELYTVADLSNVLGLASAVDVASNYVMMSSMYESGQTSTGKLEKPNLTNVQISRGVREHVVKEGETMDAIAATYGLTTDQIRWSNGLKTTDINPGSVLYLPSTAGIVYTVKSGDTIDSIAAKYGSNPQEIIALNDLENSGVAEGMRIVIKNGSLPTTERPEYVPPAPRFYATYTYLGNASTRSNLACNRGLGAGQCTTWGWLKRPDLGFIKANANRWDDIARAHGLRVDKSPSPGSIFQTDSGWYGHVGYVESVNGDGSINVSERNYAGCWGVLYSTIPASEVGKFWYIH
ncbi:LysM peptidoglycan-binding domain-containing protein [Candidatus Saccharibacteria bacterium]|nr:LysM peptidoglycan-binding domain-containing protein [Candidatus Saccharibacteria bacterium]